MGKKFMLTLLVIGLCAVINSCDTDETLIDDSEPIYYGYGKKQMMFGSVRIDGYIYYNTYYKTVDRIEFTVTGGTGNYRLYYAESKYNWITAGSSKKSIGTSKNGEKMVYKINGNLSSNYNYYIWAYDDNDDYYCAQWTP